MTCSGFLTGDFVGSKPRILAGYPLSRPHSNITTRHFSREEELESSIYIICLPSTPALSKGHKGTSAAPPRPKTANLGFRTTTGAREGLSGPAPSPVARAIYWRNPRRTEQNSSCVTRASSGTPPPARLRETCCARSVVRPLRPSVSCVSAPSRTCPLWVQLRG